MQNHIETQRKALGLTQQQLAEKLGVSRQTVISLEAGRYNPSLLLARKLALLFGTHIEDLFIFEEESL